MAWVFGFCLFLLLHFPVVLGQGKHSITQAAEYRLRQALFAQYDRMVRPVLQPSDVMNITFQVELKALKEVNTKTQVVTTDTAVTQSWTNPFLQWNPDDYDGINQILVVPNEIWVPDIVLENNADDEVVQAGYLEKFRSFVKVHHDGVNMWASPATFKSTCKLDVQFFPFDKQKCSLVFRSLTAGRSLLEILAKNIKSDDPDEELKLNTQNGYWSLRSLEIKADDHNNGRQFSEVVMSFFIGRRPMFFVLFSIVPCMIIGMLILVSFFIPAESGERIGLCATILLAVSVYLLVVTEQLPEQSDTLPLIGVYYIVIMFEIGLALSATVLVLMAHHATSKPPKFLTYLIVLNNITACCRVWKRKMAEITPPLKTKAGAQDAKGKKRQKADMTPPIKARAGEENAGMPTEEEDESKRNDVELEEVKVVDESPSSAFSILTENEDSQNEEMWKEIARAMDRIFFWLFLALFGVSSVVVYSQAGRLASLDVF